MKQMEFARYTELGFNKLDNDSFNKVIASSQLLVGNLAKDYYEFHDIQKDLNSDDDFIKFRANQFQKAICVQCEFADDLGASSLVEQQKAGITDVQIGRTHLQQSSNPVNSVTYGKSGVYLPAYELLVHTGLLYRGVDSH